MAKSAHERVLREVIGLYGQWTRTIAKFGVPAHINPELSDCKALSCPLLHKDGLSQTGILETQLRKFVATFSS